MKTLIVMPAYNAEATLRQTYKDLPEKYKKQVLLVDDCSTDRTTAIAYELGVTVIQHQENKGYGGNQKTCYREALQREVDVVVMIHPDYQYDTRVIDMLIKPIELGYLDIVLGNRIRTRKESLSGGMPLIKYLLNRALSLLENVLLGVNLGEHLSGMRAYRREVLKALPLERFSDDFVFDQQLIISAGAYGFRIGDVPIPVRYFQKSSSIGYLKGTKYLLETFYQLILYGAFRVKVYQSSIFNYSDRL